MTGHIHSSREGAVVTLTIANPARRNAITLAMYDSLEEQFAAIGADPSVRALVLRGHGEAFAGGTDIGELAAIRTGADGVAYEAQMRRVQEGLLALDVPVVSVVRGPCAGGGLVLAALSDLVLCSDDARFGSPIARTIANTFSATSLARLQQCFGRRATAEMLFTGRLLSAERAAQAGFVTDVVPAGELEARLTELLEEVLACAPLTLRSFKQLGRRLDEQAGQVQVEDIYATIYSSHDFHEGVTAFLDRRTPKFRGD